MTENGCAVHETSVKMAIQDDERIAFYSVYINAMHDAIVLDGAKVNGYFGTVLFERKDGWMDLCGCVY